MLGERTLYPSPRLLRRLLEFAPHAVVAGGFSFPALYACAYCQARKASLVLFSDGTSETEQGLDVASSLARSFLVSRAGAAVGASKAAARRFSELGVASERIVVAPYALDHAARPVRDFARAGPPPRLLFVGQFIPRKGVAELLDAFRDVRDEYDATLTIVGHGPLEEDLRSRIAAPALAGTVELRGFVDQPDLPQLYAEHDLLIMPSLEDTFGVVLLEGMLAGLPVIASSRAGATADYVVHGHSGWIVDPRSPMALAAALRDALTLRANWPALGAAARARLEAASPPIAANEMLRALSLAASVE